MTAVLEACLNGDRMRGDHPELPLTPGDIARDASAAVAAGARALHVHPRDGGGRPTMGPHQTARTVHALREAVPGTPFGFTTIASIEPDPKRRVALLRNWTAKPDFVSVNWSEDGAAALAVACVERDIGIEAGIWTEDDARAFVDSELAPFCVRALVEPITQRAGEAIATAERIVETLAPSKLPLVVHGHDRTAWALLRWAAAHGHGIRAGLEDMLTLEGGRPAKDNAAIVANAARLLP